MMLRCKYWEVIGKVIEQRTETDNEKETDVCQDSPPWWNVVLKQVSQSLTKEKYR